MKKKTGINAIIFLRKLEGSNIGPKRAAKMWDKMDHFQKENTIAFYNVRRDKEICATKTYSSTRCLERIPQVITPKPKHALRYWKTLKPLDVIYAKDKAFYTTDNELVTYCESESKQVLETLRARAKNDESRLPYYLKRDLNIIKG